MLPDLDQIMEEYDLYDYERVGELIPKLSIKPTVFGKRMARALLFVYYCQKKTEMI